MESDDNQEGQRELEIRYPAKHMRLRDDDLYEIDDLGDFLKNVDEQDVEISTMADPHDSNMSILKKQTGGDRRNTKQTDDPANLEDDQDWDDVPPPPAAPTLPDRTPKKSPGPSRLCEKCPFPDVPVRVFLRDLTNDQDPLQEGSYKVLRILVRFFKDAKITVKDIRDFPLCKEHLSLLFSKLGLKLTVLQSKRAFPMLHRITAITEVADWVDFKREYRTHFHDKSMLYVPENAHPSRDGVERIPLPTLRLLPGKIRPKFVKVLEDYLFIHHGFSIDTFKKKGLSPLDLLGDRAEITKLLPAMRDEFVIYLWHHNIMRTSEPLPTMVYSITQQIFRAHPLIWMASVVLREDNWGYLVHEPIPAGYEHPAYPKISSNQSIDSPAIVNFNTIQTDHSVEFLVQFDETYLDTRQSTYYSGVSDPTTFIKWENFLKISTLYEKRLVLNEENSGEAVQLATGIELSSTANISNGKFFTMAIHPDIPVGKQSGGTSNDPLRSLSLRMLRYEPGKASLEHGRAFQELRINALTGPRVKCNSLSAMSDAWQGILSWESPTVQRELSELIGFNVEEVAKYVEAWDNKATAELTSALKVLIDSEKYQHLENGAVVNGCDLNKLSAIYEKLESEQDAKREALAAVEQSKKKAEFQQHTEQRRSQRDERIESSDDEVLMDDYPQKSNLATGGRQPGFLSGTLTMTKAQKIVFSEKTSNKESRRVLEGSLRPKSGGLTGGVGSGKFGSKLRSAIDTGLQAAVEPSEISDDDPQSLARLPRRSPPPIGLWPDRFDPCEGNVPAQTESGDTYIELRAKIASPEAEDLILDDESSPTSFLSSSIDMGNPRLYTDAWSSGNTPMGVIEEGQVPHGDGRLVGLSGDPMEVNSVAEDSVSNGSET